MRTKYLFPITFNAIVGFACVCAMTNGTYYIFSPTGWDNAGFWLNATQVNSAQMNNVPYVIYIAFGY